jgi:hypothetical protein
MVGRSYLTGHSAFGPGILPTNGTAATVIRTYLTGPIPRRMLTGAEQNKCQIIQQQKNALLTALKSYFSQNLNKPDLKTSLANIRSTVVANCPAPCKNC